MTDICRRRQNHRMATAALALTLSKRCVFSFYLAMLCTAQTMPSSRRKMSVSVRLSAVRHTPVFCRNMSSNFFHRRVTTQFKFFCIKQYGNIPTGTPVTGALNETGLRFSTNFSLYLRNDTIQSHSHHGRQIGNHTQAFKWYHFQ